MKLILLSLAFLGCASFKAVEMPDNHRRLCEISCTEALLTNGVKTPDTSAALLAGCEYCADLK